jgi:hypothetical protein
MLHNSVPRNIAFSPKTQVLHLFTCRMLSKCSETLPNIILGPMEWNGWFTTLVSQNCAFRLGRKFCIFFVSRVSEMLWNTPKHQFGSYGVEWMLHNFGTPKHCIQSGNTSFASFDLSKVSEMLWNTPKHHFGSNGVEWMVNNFVTPKQGIKARTQVLHVLLAEDNEMIWNTLKHHFGSNGVEWMVHNFGTLK